MADYIAIKSTCPLCEESAVIEVPIAGFNKWQNGAYIQDALPELDADTREQLITGTCPPCWTRLFNAEEHEHD